MRQRKPPQPDLLKTHQVPPSQRTTAVALLKTLLIEAMFAQPITVEDPPTATAGNSGVEIGEASK